MAASQTTSKPHSIIFALLFTDENADCRFQFIDESTAEVKEYAAHQKVLAAVSPVFRVMFNSNWNNSKNPIAIKDVTYELFTAFMDYFYKNEVELTSENAFGILQLADKYDVEPLVNCCEAFLMAELSVENVLVYHAIALQYKCDRLEAKCLDLFRGSYEAILQSEEFLDCDNATLAAFLWQLPKPCVAAKVFDKCIEWAKAKCAADGIAKPKMFNLRSALGECFGLMRFNDMSYQEFDARFTSYKQMFTKGESDAIFVHLRKKRAEEYSDFYDVDRFYLEDADLSLDRDNDWIDHMQQEWESECLLYSPYDELDW